MGTLWPYIHDRLSRLAQTSITSFELRRPDGIQEKFGSGDAAFTLHLKTSAALRALASLDELAVARAYINGQIDIEGDFFAALDLRRTLTDRHTISKGWRFIRRFIAGRDREDKTMVPRHYDRGNSFYFSFLDKQHKLYSQALYRTGQETLEQAATNKLDYIHEICRLKPGHTVLDVGAGWGSFAKDAAARGVNVTMLTISREQYGYLSELSARAGTPGRLQPVLETVFRYEPPTQVDAIVVLGVMEHLPDYDHLFERFARFVKPHGRVYMDFSATRKKYDSSTVTYEHIFEGNHSPVVMHDLMRAANASPFELVTAHNDRHSYYLTLQAWARNLEAARAQLCEQFGQPTFRLFQVYLWGTAHNMNREGRVESYRVIWEKSKGLSSVGVGL